MEATECPFHAAAPGNPKTNAADKEGESKSASTENPADQDIEQADHQCPEMVRFTDRPIDRLGFRSITAQEARRLSVCVIGWVSEVRQIALKEEGIDLRVMPDD